MDIEVYFQVLEAELKRAYEIAAEARKKGFDPELTPEIPLARDLAERVEGLVGPLGVAARIRELSAMHSKEDAAMEIAREIVEGKFSRFSSEEEACEQALRTCLAVLTEGVVSAPLEGIVNVKIKKNHDRSRYLAIYFAGPIRSAGGSAEALAVLTGDYIRRALGLDRYKPTREEIERFAEEVDLYNAEAAHLQYLPPLQDVRKTVANIPVEITGEKTEQVEVSGYRDLERVETNCLRGGAVLVLAEGVLQKASKVLKYVEKLKLEGWEWLGEFTSTKVKSEEDKFEIKPSTKYIKDLIAGRPVLSHPSAKGGLRLRYGRCRNSGLASTSLHPATMVLLDGFIVTGTQIKTERPGKGSAVTPCDTIEGPIVKLSDGSVVRVESVEQAENLKEMVKEILFLGDVLISFGDFVENNHPLLPSGYVEEWWVQELEEVLAAVKPKQQLPTAGGAGTVSSDFTRFLDSKTIPTQEEALEISELLNVPLHPRCTYFYHDVSKEDLKLLAFWLSTGTVDKNENALIIKNSDGEKRILEVLGVPHNANGGMVKINEYKPLLRALGMDESLSQGFLEAYEGVTNTMELVNSFGIKIREKAPSYIGARMGRPEKADSRKMKPPVNVLFPIGNAGGKTRDVEKAADAGAIKVELAHRKCSCGEVTFTTLCPRCGKETKRDRVCVSCERVALNGEEKCKACGGITSVYHEIEIQVKELLDAAVKRVGKTPNNLKGVIGMSSAYKIPEPLEKGILRSKHGVYVFKDGTARFDATDVPLTHFKPCEVGVSVEKLKELGYDRDYLDAPLEYDCQILELKCQDILLAESGADYLLKVSKFIDEMLEKLYCTKSFYSAQRREDLLGHLVLGLAPHTSAAILGRIVGFTRASVGYAHPYFHAAKRRNCDGDEDAVFLLMDALLNFSRAYLPNTRGGKMDAPLVLTTRLDPREIDDEAHNLDIAQRYPLAFYDATMRVAKPQEMVEIIQVVSHRIGKPEQYSGFRFTHDTSDIAAGPANSSYKTLGEMAEKVLHQLSLAAKIRAVDERDVARRVIESHFLPDIAGNLRTFSKQKIRCVDCNATYRRVPLSGVCRKCGGKLVLTVSKGSVQKYLETTKSLIEKYALEDYLRQRVRILEMSISSVFESDSNKQHSLADFLE